MKEILTAGVVLLALIGLGIMRLLEKVRSLLEEIRENMPDKHFPTDPERGLAAGNAFWKEIQRSMNLIVRIHGKFVNGEDYLADSREFREKIEQMRCRADIDEANDDNREQGAQGLQDL